MHMNNHPSELRPMVEALLKRSEIEILDQDRAGAEIGTGSTGLIYVSSPQASPPGHKHHVLLSFLSRLRSWAEVGASSVSFFLVKGKYFFQLYLIDNQHRKSRI